MRVHTVDRNFSLVFKPKKNVIEATVYHGEQGMLKVSFAEP